MPYVEHFRVEESLVVTGTGAVTTGATPVAGSQTFADVGVIGDTFPLWIVDSTASPPTIEASLGTYSAANTLTRTLVPGGSAALVTFLGNACSVFIARIPGGNAAQTLNAAQATVGTEVVTLAQAQADFAALAGLSTQPFEVAPGSGSQAINLTQADGRYIQPQITLAASVDLDTIVTPGFYALSATPVNAPPSSAWSTLIVTGNTDTVGQSVIIFGNGSQWFRRGAGVAGSTPSWSVWYNVAVSQNDNGFLVPQTLPAATASGHAVNLGQAQANFAALAGLSTQPFEVGAATLGTHAVNLTQAENTFPKLTIKLVAGTDLNTVVQSGFYTFASTVLNGPGTVSYSQMIVNVNIAVTTITQTVYDFTSGQVWTRSGSPSDAGGAGIWEPWLKLAADSIDTNFTVPQTLPAATASGHAVNLAQAQALFAPIAQNNAPVDRNLAGDLIATVYTNTTAQVWTDYITPDGVGATDITVSGVQIMSSATEIMAVTTPPGGTIELTTTQPTGWFRVVM